MSLKIPKKDSNKTGHFQNLCIAIAFILKFIFYTLLGLVCVFCQPLVRLDVLSQPCSIDLAIARSIQ